MWLGGDDSGEVGVFGRRVPSGGGARSGGLAGVVGEYVRETEKNVVWAVDGG